MEKLLGTSILIGTLRVRSVQLTPAETVNLENQERALNGEIRADRQANGGKLTSAERAQINGQQAP